MKGSILSLSLFAVAIIASSSCKPDKECEDAGTGGNLTVVATLKHHSKVIYNQPSYPDTVYVKFNTQDMPDSVTPYDTYFVGEAGEDHVHLEGLKCGDYYFYGAGFDTLITQRVIGGIPFTTTQTDGEIELNVPVTEGD